MAENTIIHEISLAGYKATSTGGMLDLGTWGSYGIEKLHLTLDAAWQDLTITAFFNVNGKVVAKRVVGKDGYADVPWEATKENTFSGCLAFEGSINGQRRISTNLNYKVTNHSETTDSDPVPTDDRWNQFVTETKGYRDGAFEAAERANTRSEDAETASEDAQAAQDAQTATAAAKAEAVKAQEAAQTAAKSAQDAQAASENVRDDAQTAQQGAEAARDAAAKSAEAAAKSEANVKQSADTLAESVKNITPDDSSIGDKPWSSKHIIDMLCPPLEESGNPVVCYPVAGYPLGVKAKWEPMQEGTGTPSPENIRPIKGRDSVRVTRCGETLWSLDKITLQTFNTNITTQIDMDAVNLLPRNVKLYFSGQCSNGKLREIRFYDGTGAEMGTLCTEGGYSTVIKAGNIAKVLLYAGLNENSERTCTNLQITPGTTAPTTYTPYIGQSNTLTLPSTIYGGEVDAVSGEGQDTWKSVSLDGTEKWNTWGVNKNNTNVTGFFTYDINDYSNDGSDINKILCSTMSNEEKNIWGGKNMGVGLANSGSSKYLIYCVTTNTLPDTTDDKKAIASFKTFLANLYAAGTPVQVAYKLATQTPFTATGAQPMPALAGANTVLTDADSATVTGRADPIKRITDSEDAVASIN